MIKLIMSDMDGTLLDENGMVPKGFDEMAAKLKDRGVIFVPASGRQYYSLLSSFPGHEDDFIFLAENGTLAKYKGKELFSSPLPKEYARQAWKAGLQLPDIFVVFCGKKDAYVLRDHQKPEYIAELRKYYTHNAVVDSFDNIDDEAIKISLYDVSGNAGKSVYPHMEQFNGRMQVVRSSDYWVDVMRSCVNKGTAIQQIQRKLKITPMECAAFGDYLNDLEMMSSVYYSFAMANAHHKIKEVARFETKSNAEAGVLAGIQRLMDEGLI